MHEYLHKNKTITTTDKQNSEKFQPSEWKLIKILH